MSRFAGWSAARSSWNHWAGSTDSKSKATNAGGRPTRRVPAGASLAATNAPIVRRACQAIAASPLVRGPEPVRGRRQDERPRTGEPGEGVDRRGAGRGLAERGDRDDVRVFRVGARAVGDPARVARLGGAADARDGIRPGRLAGAVRIVRAAELGEPALRVDAARLARRGIGAGPCAGEGPGAGTRGALSAGRARVGRGRDAGRLARLGDARRLRARAGP